MNDSFGKNRIGAEDISHLLLSALGVLLVLFAYWPSLWGPFFSDDFVYVANNPNLAAIPIEEPWRFFIVRTNPYEYLPIRDLSYRLDLALFGVTSPLGYKIHNLLLYGICCMLIWPCVRCVALFLGPKDDVGQSKARNLATACTVLFAAHPAHVESVAWISGRKELLSGIFVILALWLFARALLDGGRRRVLGIALASLSFALALMAKTSVSFSSAAFLALAIATSERPGLRDRCKAGLRALPILGVAVAGTVLYLIVAWDITVLGNETEIPELTEIGQPMLAVLILGSLTRIALFPWNMRLMYDLGDAGLAQVVALILGALVLLCTLFAIRGVWRRPSWYSISILLFSVTLIPYLQLIHFQTWSIASERFLFLPLLGVVMVVAMAIQHLRSRVRVAAVVTIFLIASGMSFARAGDWQDNGRLLEQNAASSPRHAGSVSFWVHATLLPAGMFERADKAARGIRDELSREMLVRLISVKSAIDRDQAEDVKADILWLVQNQERAADTSVRSEIGNVALIFGMQEAAAQIYMSILRKQPWLCELHYNLGLAQKKLRRFDLAERSFQAAIDYGLARADAWNSLGSARNLRGDSSGAERAFRKAIELDGLYWFAAYNLAQGLAKQGRREEAITWLQKARRAAIAKGDSVEPIDRLLEQIEGK